MNKHITGIVIFSLIVGVSAIIASFFIQMPQIPKLEPVKVSEPDNAYVYTGHTNCWGSKRRMSNYNKLASAEISQAVYDTNKKQLDTQFAIERADDSTEVVNIALHFYANDRFGVRHLATEFISLDPNFDIGDKAITTKINTFDWLNKLQSRENLYVIPEVISDSRNYRQNPPAFNSSEATAILLN